MDIHCAVLGKDELRADGFQVSKYFSFGYSLRKLGLRETRGGSKLRIKNAKLKIQNSALKEREYTEDWVNENQETAATIFWNLWKMGAEVELDTDSRKEIFLGILAGADDITEELLDQLHSEYS